MIWKFLKKNWILILSLIYILSPIDFIPEALIGPLGIIDDVALVILLLINSTFKAIAESKKNNDRSIT